MVKPLTRPTIVKKRTKKFIRHQADRFMRVSFKWRKAKGIDSRVRRRFRDQIKNVKIGYGTDKTHRHVLKNGFKLFPVNNVKELEMLLMNNRVYAAEIAHGVSSQKRKAIVERAEQLDIKVMNKNAKLRTEEHE